MVALCVGFGTRAPSNLGDRSFVLQSENYPDRGSPPVPVGAAGVSQLFITGAVAAQDHAEVPHEDASESAAVTEGGDAEATPAPPPLWPDVSAVDVEKQPYMLIRALRAVQDALHHSSLAFIRSLKVDKKEIDVEVTIGVQEPAKVDVEKVKASLPVGNVTVKAVKGGLDIPDPENNDPAVIASAAIAVRVPLP